MNHRYEKINSKKEETNKKEKALHGYNKQCKQQYQWHGKYGHKPGDRRCPKNNNKKEENEKKNEYKNKIFEGICYHCGQKGVRRNGNYKKFEKAEKVIDGDGDELVLSSLMRGSKKEKNYENKKVCLQIMSNSLLKLV